MPPPAQSTHSSAARPGTYWSAGFLLLIIIGVALFFFRPSEHPLVLAYRLGLIAVGILGLIVITFATRGSQKRAAAHAASGGDVHALAVQILQQQKDLYSRPHEFFPANTAEFPDLDPQFYSQVQAALLAEGFRLLDDIENATLSAALPALRTFARTLIGDEDTTAARISQIRPAGRNGRDLRIIELTTEFSDYSFLCTTSAELSLDGVTESGITTYRYPANTPISDLLRYHRLAFTAKLAKSPAVQPVKCPNLEAVLASARRMHAVRAVHRKRNGYVTEEDLKLLRGEPLTDLDRRIYEQINQLELTARTATSAPSDE